MNTLVSSKGRLDLFVSNLLIKFFQVLSPWTWSSLGRFTLNCAFSFLYLLIFMLCARGNRPHSVFEVIGGDSVPLNYWYHCKYGTQVMHATIDIRVYQFRSQQSHDAARSFVKDYSPFLHEKAEIDILKLAWLNSLASVVGLAAVFT